MLPTRTSVKAERTRTVILEAALALFKEKGAASTTMREIAEQASMAVGATYYHFRNKDQIVFAFYEATQDGSEERAKETNKSSRDFRTRVEDIISFKLAQLGEYRDFLGQLASHAFVPNSSLSPFSEETRVVRERAIAIFEDAIAGSNLKVDTEVRTHLPKLFWLYQMAIVLYWLHDRSTNQAQTKKFITASLDMIMKFISLSRIPVLRQVNQMILSLLKYFPEGIQRKKE